MRKQIRKLLSQAVRDGVIKCRSCGKSLEPDTEKCPCGWKNPLIEKGFI